MLSIMHFYDCTVAGDGSLAQTVSFIFSHEHLITWSYRFIRYTNHVAYKLVLILAHSCVFKVDVNGCVIFVNNSNGNFVLKWIFLSWFQSQQSKMYIWRPICYLRKYCASTKVMHSSPGFLKKEKLRLTVFWKNICCSAVTRQELHATHLLVQK